ncbi:putative phosphoglycerate mutase [Streptomyces sp. Ag109_G2-6]|uniref:bifunctional RNase H/acid phosphatase n=1 Tax=Streptomyces TaxID=1883 RepID=UPI0009A55161|nr:MULTISPECIES: bifunctional RNase H/acid phosphatase [Streptomyces]RPF40325.1 putative phosphoglycerate mutase [Streptomyces sp. Ag109_G2-6]
MPRFVVEADGGSRGNPGPAGYGAVVLDPVTGETLAERAEFIGVATNNVAEYRGLIAGLKAARELAADAEVRVRMDSKLVVEQMSGRWKIKHPDMKPLAAEAATVLPRGQVTYEWIPRERNKHADRLANEAMDAGRRGGQWEPSASTADLPPQGPPGDAAKGAAAVRAAMASGGATRPAVPADSAAAAESHPAPAGTDVRAAHTAAGPATPSGPATPGTATADVRAARSAAHGTPSAGPAARDAAADLRAARTAAGPEADTLFGEAEALAPVAPAQTPAPGSAPAGAAAQSPAGLAARGAGAPAAAAQPRATAGGTGTGWGGPDMGAPATFVLLRHGETALTPQKRFSGSGGTDPELSEAGRRQAAAVAEALAARGTVQAVVSSPLRRCRETAQAVADRLGLPVTVEEGLRETDFGAWEGLTFAEVRERFPDDLQAWLDSPKAAPTGGGESFAAVTRRVSATRDRLLSAYAGRTVLLVTHVTPVKTLVRLALGAPPESLFKMELSAASLSAVAYYADGNTSVRLLNDTSHLR